MRSNGAFAFVVVAVLGVSSAFVCAHTAPLANDPCGLAPEPSPGCTFYAAPSSAPEDMPVGRTSNDGLSPASPFLVSDFWEVAQPGDTLLLLDGYYMGPSSMINALEACSVNGTAVQPITIAALNDGAVLIDGEYAYLPLCIAGTPEDPKRYFVVEGIDVCNSVKSVVTLHHCEDCTVRRVCAWSAHPEKNAHIYTLDSTFRCLVEDCAAWGLGRKQLLVYGDSNETEICAADNVVRRFWCRWEGTRYEGRHSENISFQYRSAGSLLENVICTHDAWDSIDYPSDWTFLGFFCTDGSNELSIGARLRGCIGYVTEETNVLMPYVFLMSGTNVLDVTLGDCLSYVAPDRTRGLADYEISGLVTSARYYDSVHAEHLTVVGGAGVRIGARLAELSPDGPVIENALVMRTVNPLDWFQAAVIRPRYVDGIYFFDNDENFDWLYSCADAPTNILSPPGFEGNCSDFADLNETCRTAPGIDPLLREAGHSLVRPHTSPLLANQAPDGTDVGARLWFRYVDGELIDSQAEGGPEYLWPWPMEQRIWQATSDYYLLDPENHPPPVSVTRQVLTLDGGALPGDSDGDGDVDEADRVVFENLCPTPDVAVADPNAPALDFDEDGDIDEADRQVFEQWYDYDRLSCPAEVGRLPFVFSEVTLPL